MNIKQNLQKHLIGLGLLDPPVDGIWGQQSKAALKAFQRMIGELESESPSQSNLNLISTYVDPGITYSDSTESKIIQYMSQKGYFISRGTNRFNIVYLEGVNTDFTTNDDQPDKWNDLRLIISVDNGKPVLMGKWSATTEPGYYYTQKKLLNPKGAFRIAFGQQCVWRVGVHSNDHEALVQRAPVKGYRDSDKNFIRDGDPLVTGSFGINQHWGYDQANVGKASAGCLVGQSKNGHRRFMSIIKSDERYKVSKNNFFFTTVIDGRDLLN